MQNAPALAGKGAALYKLERIQEALDAFEQSIRVDPTYREAWAGKSVCLQKLGREEEAQEAMRKAREF